MALSTDEENKVREIIEAFTNGKRLSDLPDVSGNNPFKLLCEVLEDGESKKAALAAMLPYMEENCMYGFWVILFILVIIYRKKILSLVKWLI